MRDAALVRDSLPGPQAGLQGRQRIGVLQRVRLGDNKPLSVDDLRGVQPIETGLFAPDVPRALADVQLHVLFGVPLQKIKRAPSGLRAKLLDRQRERITRYLEVLAHLSAVVAGGRTRHPRRLRADPLLLHQLLIEQEALRVVRRDLLDRRLQLVAGRQVRDLAGLQLDRRRGFAIGQGRRPRLGVAGSQDFIHHGVPLGRDLVHGQAPLERRKDMPHVAEDARRGLFVSPIRASPRQNVNVRREAVVMVEPADELPRDQHVCCPFVRELPDFPEAVAPVAPTAQHLRYVRRHRVVAAGLPAWARPAVGLWARDRRAQQDALESRLAADQPAARVLAFLVAGSALAGVEIDGVALGEVIFAAP